MRIPLVVSGLRFIAGLVVCVVAVFSTNEWHRLLPAPPASAVLAQTPLGFEANRGQAASSYQFIARQPGFSLGLAINAVTVTANDLSHPLKLRFIGARADVALQANEALSGPSHYLIGNDAAQWQTNVARFARVRYAQLYSGVDAVFYGRGKQLEYDWVIAPHADAQQIRFTFAGAEAVRLDESGALMIEQGKARLRQHAPVAFQETAHGRRSVTARYVIGADNVIGFALGEYDATLPLVIDPVLSYATYFGGSGVDAILALTTDAAGNIYVAGQTTSLNLPLRTPYEDTFGGGTDAFVTKLDPTGARIIFSTYLGGRGTLDRVWDLAVDKSSNIYLTGETNSLAFPTTPNAAQGVRGNGDAFVTKLNAQGTALVYSTYLGGNQADEAYGLALDEDNAVYVTGRTESPNFPSINPVQATLRGERDVFVTKLSSVGAFVFSTYLGGAGEIDEEIGFGIAVDALHQVYVTGATTTVNFPTVNAWQPRWNGESDAFLLKLDPDASRLLFSTYLGGTEADAGRAVVVDAFGNPCLTGVTASLHFPLRSAWQNIFGGGTDAFVMKFRAAGGSPIFSTRLGGRGDENTGSPNEFTIPVGDIAVDSLGALYVTGKTVSENFPVERAVQETRRGDNDAFITKFTPGGNALAYSTYFGTSFVGNNGYDERGHDIAVDSQGNAYVAGQMLGNDLFTMLPLQSRTNGGASEGFIARISAPDLATFAPVSAASYIGASLAPDSIVSLFGVGLAPNVDSGRSVPLPTTLQGVTVNVTDSANVTRAAPLFFVSPGQINLLIPANTATGAATLTLTNSPNAPVTASVLIQATAPALFTANGDGTGVPAALALRVKADGTLSYESVAYFDEFQQRIFPLPLDLGAENEQVYLILFGSGMRNRSSLSATSMRIGGMAATPLYLGAQGGYVGLDQVNVLVPRALAGRGNVKIETVVDGQLANALTLNIR
ncbi:MAG: hypothetical protein HOP19_16915 [Acidobacteria bacterium]|nr:hypothetical protein [Acidobacteriota bacterium]